MNGFDAEADDLSSRLAVLMRCDLVTDFDIEAPFVTRVRQQISDFAGVLGLAEAGTVQDADLAVSEKVVRVKQ